MLSLADEADEIEREFMRKTIIPVLIAAGMLLLQGCGSGTVTESTIEISRKGTVKQTTIGTLDSDYYDSDELKSYVKDQVDSYNDDEDAAGTVKLKKYKYKKSDQSVKIILKFSDDETYADFEQMPFFIGTADEAEAAGYDFAVTLIAAADAPSADETASGDASGDTSGDSSGDITDASADASGDASGDASADASADSTASLGLSGEETVVILQESYNVTVPGEVLYVTDGTCAMVSEDTVAVTADADELVYIIYE